MTPPSTPPSNARPGTPEQLGVGELEGATWPADGDDTFDHPADEVTP